MPGSPIRTSIRVPHIGSFSKHSILPVSFLILQVLF